MFTNGLGFPAAGLSQGGIAGTLLMLLHKLLAVFKRGGLMLGIDDQVV